METKQAKTFEQCKDEVVQKQGYKNWSYYVIAYQPGLGTTYEERLHEAAELYNQETAAERDRLKEELEAIKLVPSSYEGRVDLPELREICAKRFFNKSFEELTSDKDLIRLYQLIGATLDELRYAYAGENAMQSKEIDSLKQLNSELLEFFQRNEMLWTNTQDKEKFESLISKANQQKEKP